MRLLKEFSTRELIDALSYDFDPLQGMVFSQSAAMTPRGTTPRSSPLSARVSTLEVAIRAQAKKFLAHPLVVQQLEAIWAGTIVFHSTADSLHRRPAAEIQHMSRHPSIGDRELSPRRGRPSPQPVKQPSGSLTPVFPVVRRTVTLYDPHDASMFKLSRLRVPRYRQLFSTGSFAIMLGLFLAVLFEKSQNITGLEVVFWFWSAGYMLDELVGFSEQGFGLYIMSVWNAFDLGILILFVVYYVLRLYGILMPDVQKGDIASMAYDVLGSSAVLLFPRLFSVLDHSRYFSQLLIAFRMMAVDLVAILMLIVITCSGFFVAFTLSFTKDLDAPSAAYALFQMVMGFTPAAWEIWADYNPLGKTLLTLFLFICHFLIVTILITVLTNSFMAIVQNAEEEHQFLFAVNAISMVKSDALFSYIPPTNILGWLLIPLKFFMSFSRFIRMNRMIIKITHLPILFPIFLYERLILSNLAYGPTDLVEQRGRQPTNVPAFSIKGQTAAFSPGTRLREPSITTFRKDRALEEVFRRPFRKPTETGSHIGRRKSSNVVRDWMKAMETDGAVSPPEEETRSVLDRLETRRPRMRRTMTSQEFSQRRQQWPATTKPVGSDPGNTLSFAFPGAIAEEDQDDPAMSIEELHQQTDADGDDELVTNDENDPVTSDHDTGERGNGLRKKKRGSVAYPSSEDEYFRTPMTIKARTPVLASSVSSLVHPRQRGLEPSQRPPTKSRPGHQRNLSTNTVLFSPTKEPGEQSSRSPSPSHPPRTRSGAATPSHKNTDGRQTPRRSALPGTAAARPRAIMPPPRDLGQSPRPLGNFLSYDGRGRETSFGAAALDLASDLGDNRHGPNFGTLGTLPASFTTHWEMGRKAKNASGSDDDANRMSRIMLARMTTLEEGFRDVLREVKELRRGSEDGRRSREGSKHTNMGDELAYISKKKGKMKRRPGSRRGGEDGDKLGSSV